MALPIYGPLWALWRSGLHTVASLARQSGTSWPTLRRRLGQAERACRWMEREENLALAGVHPCADPGRSWTPFTQALSHACRPG